MQCCGHGTRYALVTNVLDDLNIGARNSQRTEDVTTAPMGTITKMSCSSGNVTVLEQLLCHHGFVAARQAVETNLSRTTN